MNRNIILYAYLRELAANPHLQPLNTFIQHGSTTCLLHSIAVAYVSLKIARFLRMKIRENELIRGAMLHDYFLYDWHVKDPDRPPHATQHPAVALNNADRDFDLTEVEKNIIRRHMFPLTPVPPKYREGWLVTLADKGCSLYETFHRKNAYQALRARYLD